MIAKIKTAGAHDVIQHGKSWQEADEYLQKVVMRSHDGAVYVPPFDHAEVWNGNASMIDELLEKPDAIICSVGGGGLFCGVQLGLQRRGWEDVCVLAVETEGAESLNKSMKAGRLQTLDDITSIATSLGAKQVARKAFQLGQRMNVRSVVLSDAEAAMGCWRLADDERFIVEPACGVTAAMCYNGRLKGQIASLNKESKVVIVLCGGSNITLEILMEYRRKYADLEKTMPIAGGIASALTAPT